MPNEVIELITNIFNFVATYFMTACMILLVILPFNVQVKKENPEHFASSAPVNPMIRKKMFISALISVPVAAIIEYIVHYSGFSLKSFLINF